jgi:hypothetical protein
MLMLSPGRNEKLVWKIQVNHKKEVLMCATCGCRSKPKKKAKKKKK